MFDDLHKLDFFHPIHWPELLQIGLIMALFWSASMVVRWSLRRLAENVHPSSRLKILRLVPWIRFLLALGAISIITPMLIEPSFENVVAVLVSASVLIAFVFKDYASSVTAGALAVVEDLYQLGDWVYIDGSYGEVVLINPRAVHLLTAEDDEIIIPNNQLWNKKIINASSGQRSMMCVADFYLHPEHDGQTVLRCLNDIGQSSAYRTPDTEVSVVASEKPWGTHYKIKAYVKESREQFTFITDLTVRGKKVLQEHRIRFAQVIPVQVIS